MPTNQVVKAQASTAMSWRKTAGTFLLRRKDGTEERIEAGQVFQALPEEIPLTFRDTIRPVDPAELEARVDPPLDVVSPNYRVEPRGKLPGRFNVVDGQGKVINEQPLTATEAQSLLEDLTR